MNIMFLLNSNDLMTSFKNVMAYYIRVSYSRLAPRKLDIDFQFFLTIRPYLFTRISLKVRLDQTSKNMERELEKSISSFNVNSHRVISS